MLEQLKKEVYEANMELPKRGLIIYMGKCQWDRQGAGPFCDQAKLCGL